MTVSVVPVPLGTVTAETFEPHVGTIFSVTVPVLFPETGAVEERTLALTLTEVRRRGGPPLSGSPPGGSPAPCRSPFALTFVGPPDVALSQHIYPLRHPGAGLLEIFLVPIGADAEGRTYEAVFN